MAGGNFSLDTIMPDVTTVLPGLDRKSDIWPWRIGLFGVGGTCIACVGVVCNCVAIVVLAHYKTSQHMSSAPFLLICLEVFDTVFLVSELFLENISTLAYGGLISRGYLPFITPVYCWAYPIPQLAEFCGTYLVVIITVERYIVVTWPLSAHRICRLAKAKQVVVTLLLGAVLLHIPLYMAYQCPRVWDNTTQREVTRFKRTDFGSSYYFTHVHMTWLKLCVNFLIPFLLLLIMNAFLLVALWRSKQSLVIEIRRQDTKERKLTAIVVCMTCVFFVCQLLAAVAFLLTSGLNKYQECSYQCNRFLAVADTTIVINASVNFLVYCASGRKFREIFSQVFLSPIRRWSSRKKGRKQRSTTTKKGLLGLMNKHTQNKNNLLTNNQTPNSNATTAQNTFGSLSSII